MEEWRNIEGTSGQYQVSNKGRVKSTRKILTLSPDKQGYLYASVKIDGKHKRRSVARLVAKEFLPRPENSLANEVNHIDFNKSNNHIENLEWLTKQQNLKHARDGKRWDEKQQQQKLKRLQQIEMEASKRAAAKAEASPENIIKARKLKGLTHKEMADALGVHVRTIFRWEKGSTSIPLSAWMLIKP